MFDGLFLIAGLMVIAGTVLGFVGVSHVVHERRRKKSSNTLQVAQANMMLWNWLGLTSLAVLLLGVGTAIGTLHELTPLIQSYLGLIGGTTVIFSILFAWALRISRRIQRKLDQQGRQLP